MCVVGGGRFLAQSSALGCGEGMCIESRTAQMIFAVHKGMVLMGFRQRQDHHEGVRRHGHVGGCPSS